MQSGRLLPIPIPVLVMFFVGLPVYWSYPAELPFWRAAGIVLGWLGCGLLLASLLLMVREVRLSAWLGGVERMTIWHHWTGLSGYLALLLHPLALAADVWREAPLMAWQLLSPFSEGLVVWVGWAAELLLMAGLASTFMPHLPYRLWRGLHGMLGIGVLLGFVHVLMLGISAGAVLALLVALLLLAWRLLRVDAGLAAKPYVVRRVRRVAEAMVEIALAPLAQPIAVDTGQFILVAFFRGRHYKGCGEYHPFTVSAASAGNEISIDVKALGDCTRLMQMLEPGVSARVQGPFGNFLPGRPDKPQFWLAGGIGITPFLACLRNDKLQQPVHLLYLFRSQAEAAFLQELEAQARANACFTLEAIATGPGNIDLAPVIPSADALVGQECYLCGPPGLVKAVSSLLQARGVAAKHIHFESFDFR